MCFVGTVDGLDKCDVVRTTSDVGKQITDPRATLPVLAKLPRTAQQIPCLCKLDARLFKRQRLSVVLGQQRLIVKRIHMRRSAVHEEKNHSLRASRKMTRSAK